MIVPQLFAIIGNVPTNGISLSDQILRNIIVKNLVIF
jgi:hypothetical protein